MSAAFSQKAVARWEHELVERVADELIDRFAGRGRAELVREFTFPYPTQIIAGLLGLPREDYPQFQRWSISLLSILVNRERGLAASNALREYFVPILEARRREPREDLISRLAQAETLLPNLKSGTLDGILLTSLSDVATLQADKVNAVRLERSGDPPLVLQRKQGKWRLIEPIAARADREDGP